MSNQRFRTSSMIILFCFVSVSVTQTGGVLKKVGGVSIDEQNIGGSSPSLEISYLANEGFLIGVDGKQVLIDALFRGGVDGYAVLSKANREKLESAASPFDGVDLVLATHHHDDHFDAQAVAAHLSRNPQALFISTPQAIEKLNAVGGFDRIKDRVVAAPPKEGERITRAHRGVTVQILNIHHGRNRPVQNLGFIVEIGGRKFLHIGDSEAEDFVFKNYTIANDGIDVAFIPYWYFFDAGWKRAVRDHIRAKQVVLMHIPPRIDQFDSQVRKMGGWTKVWAGIKTEFPNALYFEKELVSRTLPELESIKPTIDVEFVD
ncbi:MAG: MBL fold metallo-hydrolase [Acidobacteria bacterium]|nr:MBL fold metallo-hydrolase [Acidobacteriota bacterium]